eukprot:g5966.t1
MSQLWKSALESPKFSASQLQSLVTRLVSLTGSNAEESHRVAENLVTSNLKGHDSHGVGYLPRYIGTALKNNLVPNQKVKIISESDTMITLDGGRGYGQSIGFQAMEMGIAKAQKHKVCVVALRNSHHLARIGRWAEMCTEKGLLSIHFVNVAGHVPLVAPHHGADARLGTNPFTIGYPNKDSDGSNRDIILDYATSRVALGKAREALGRGEDMEDGCLLDSNGHMTNDPSVKFTEPKGSLLPFAEHKGYALALMCELLGAVATGGQTIEPSWERDDTILNSMFTIIVDPTSSCGNAPGIPTGTNDSELGLCEKKRRSGTLDSSVSSLLAAQATDLIQFVTDSPKRPLGEESVVVPGDPERSMMKERLKDGIPLAPGTWNEILSAAESLGVTEDEVWKIIDES